MVRGLHQYQLSFSFVHLSIDPIHSRSRGNFFLLRKQKENKLQASSLESTWISTQFPSSHDYYLFKTLCFYIVNVERNENHFDDRLNSPKEDEKLIIKSLKPVNFPLVYLFYFFVFPQFNMIAITRWTVPYNPQSSLFLIFSSSWN